MKIEVDFNLIDVGNYGDTIASVIQDAITDEVRRTIKNEIKGFKAALATEVEKHVKGALAELRKTKLEAITAKIAKDLGV